MNDVKINIPREVKKILTVFHNKGYKAYIVGGCVRDSIIGRCPNDWDITTNATPKDINYIFKHSGLYTVIPTGIKHGTMTLYHYGNQYEITTFRKDGDYSDNRHPNNVQFVNDLKEDLSRRDFTINAMAYNEKEGLIDYFSGIDDINNKIVRCVGNPLDRFNEDALRMMRAIRFSCQLGFNIEKNIIDSICKLYSNIQNISIERIRDEFCKILISENPIDGICHLIQSELMRYIIPEIYPTLKFNQHNIHHDKDIFWHIMTVVENIEPVLDLRLSALLHDIGKPRCFTIGENGQGHFYSHHKVSADMSKEILRRLKFDNKTIDKVSLLVYEHMSRYDKLRTPNIKKFINRVGIDNLELLFSLQIADIKGSAKEYQNFDNVLKLREQCYKILDEKQPLAIKDLKINGRDLMRVGFKQGKQIGETLTYLLEEVIENPELNDRDTLISMVKSRIK